MTKSRSFTALDLIRLPRLDAAAAQSLGTAVLAVAEGSSSLPEAVRETRDDVSIALKLLVEAATQRLPGPVVEEGPRAKDADTELDASWSGTYNWLSGWAKLPNEPKAAIAAELRERLFPEGLKFTQLKYPLQWAESNTRLSLIADAHLDASFDALGGSSFLKTLRETHKAYGDILGITKAQEEEAARATRIRDALDQLSDALRAYVLQVSAMARKSDPASQAKVDKLLAPIINWQSAPVSKAIPTPPDVPTPPTDPGEPTGSC